ncbi:MAG: HEAT repeat domain-containing protein, partial [Desulfurellaceae bacterium]|nr:HEAT repeat domain-containing protein [Desulfurellaceae bacterium]
AARQVYLASLSDQQAGVRLAGLSCLGQCPPHNADADAEAALIRILVTDPVSGVRRASAASLGRRGHRSPAVVSALHQATDDPDPSLARAAAAALKKLRPSHAEDRSS